MNGFNPGDPLPQGKTEPHADIRQMAGVAWQMYVALKDEGFTETQAMTLVKDILTAAGAAASD